MRYQIESCGAMSIDYLVIPRERPRREASRLAAQAIATPRQPSPFDLPPPPRPSASHSRTSASGSRKAVSLETSVGSSRKVSHSLIERRRREKINECLSTLRRLVPYCREEGERKEARAKERGRKRGSRMVVDDDGEQSRGGLHKLEILQVRPRFLWTFMSLNILTLLMNGSARVRFYIFKSYRRNSKRPLLLHLPRCHPPPLRLHLDQMLRCRRLFLYGCCHPQLSNHWRFQRRLCDV